ncbi:unnamed protein product [Merluccius merluccius]
MYSVEDLLISHGYKLPQHSSSSASTPAPTPTPTMAQAPSTRPAPSPLPPSYGKHAQMPEGRPGPRWTVNGYEREAGPAGRGGGCGGADVQQPQVGRVSCPNNNNNEPPRDKGPLRHDGEVQGHGDTRSESLTSDSGFCEGPKGAQPQSTDMSYWRRRGQDFTVLMDYADFREHQGGGPAGHCRPEAPHQPRGQEVGSDERQRAAQERLRWAAQTQARSREREAALHRWRMANERKCQSLGTDEWRPAVGFGRQLSESEAERWAHEQQRLHGRTPDGTGVHPHRTKAKSQSLPRMLPPDSLRYVDVASSGQELHRRVNGHPPSPHDFHRAPARWPENGRPASANQLSMTPKARFTRPPRPPSYEVHQQIRGSCEVLSGRDSVLSHARDRTPLPLTRAGDPQLDYFAQDSGPPGYIPPPSYKRAPIMRGSRRGYGEIIVDYRYRGDVYQQMQIAPDGSHWFSRHPAGSWPDPQRERSTPVQRQLYPVYTSQEHPGGGVQYIPFDDPRVRHISSALGGNSLTDADKIRHIRNELPSVTASEPGPDDSAFLPPPLGPFVAVKPKPSSNQTSSHKLDNDNNRWHSDLHKETVDNFPATDQNCNNRYPKSHRPPPSPSSVFQVSALTACSSRQGSSSEHAFTETITQVKKIVPDLGQETNRNSKRRVSETIFCLVSVPIHTPANMNKDKAADQNNNETIPRLTITNTDSVTVRHSENQNMRSQSVNEMPIRSHHSHFHTSSTSSLRNYKRAPLRKEIIDAWALQANEDKELCYAGSWPGNQYRNQETQTTSPPTVMTSPDPQSSPPNRQPPCRVSSDTTTEGSAGTDNSTSYGYPMAGQKDLHPSSNSAFSRLSLTQPPSPPPSQPGPSSPSKEQKEQGAHLPSSPPKNGSLPLDAAEQVAFGQFLLKPVDRRPWDAIGELECINKELEITINKRPNVERCSVSLDDVHSHTSACTKSDPPQNLRTAESQLPTSHSDRESISLPLMQGNKPNGVRIRSESCGPTTDPDFREVRSAFSRPQSTRDHHTHPRLPPLLLHADLAYRQDIPVPQESLLRDVGLTVYTETPGGPGEPIHRSLSSPSPLLHHDLGQPAQLVQENSGTTLVQNSSISKHNPNKELQPDEDTERKAKENLPQPRGEKNIRIHRARSENGRSSRGQGQGSPRTTRLSREVKRSFEDDVFDERFVIITEPLTYKNESTLTDKHLESLLIQEKANALPTVDLSKLYEVKSAKGIPENESMEQRAARILGIAVPVEALGVGDQQEEDKEEDPTHNSSEDIDTFSVEMEIRSTHGEAKQVEEECEEVKEPSLSGLEQDTAASKETGSDMEPTERKSGEKSCEDHSSCVNNSGVDLQQMPVLDVISGNVPEFPPSKLTLSLPVTPIEKLPMCGAEKRNRGAASKLIESLQDKLNSSASSSSTPSGRSATERMARLKELDSVSRIRRLSLKSSDSGGETEPEERDGDPEEDGEKAELKIDTTERQQVEEKGKQLKNEEVLAQQVMRPKPRQRTSRPQKPPLLPKPRSVPKREITLPLSFSTVTSGLEDEEALSVSDSYDPSRVERV